MLPLSFGRCSTAALALLVACGGSGDTGNGFGDTGGIGNESGGSGG